MAAVKAKQRIKGKVKYNEFYTLFVLSNKLINISCLYETVDTRNMFNVFV